MTLEELLDEWKIDSVIDETNISRCSIQTNELHRKYLQYRTIENMILKKYEKKYADIYKLRWSYYLGYLDQEELDSLGWEPINMKILKTDLQIFLDSDDNLYEYRLKLDIQKEKVFVIDKIIDAINKRSFLINNYIENKKFENGVDS